MALGNADGATSGVGVFVQKGLTVRVTLGDGLRLTEGTADGVAVRITLDVAVGVSGIVGVDGGVSVATGVGVSGAVKNETAATMSAALTPPSPLRSRRAQEGVSANKEAMCASMVSQAPPESAAVSLETIIRSKAIQNSLALSNETISFTAGALEWRHGRRSGPSDLCCRSHPEDER